MSVARRIIPCLDVNDGRVVKGVNFIALKDAGDPVEIAKRYNEEGADELTFLDITASSDNRGLLFDIVEKVAKQIFIPLTVGGGVRSCEDIRNLLNAGADKVGINTSAILNPDLIAASCGGGWMVRVLAMVVVLVVLDGGWLWGMVMVLVDGGCR